MSLVVLVVLAALVVLTNTFSHHLLDYSGETQFSLAHPVLQHGQHTHTVFTLKHGDKSMDCQRSRARWTRWSWWTLNTNAEAGA